MSRAPRARQRFARVSAATGVVALLSASLIATAAAPAMAAPTTVTSTYSYTGSTASFVVPSGVTALQITVVGALGGNGGADATPAPAVGSYRGVVSGTIAVTPGTTLDLAVGSGGATGQSSVGGGIGAPAGGSNPLSGFDGGAGGRTGTAGSSGQGGAGGAASVIVVGSDQIVAGGGGGNGGSGQFGPTRGRNADGTYVGRTDATSSNGQAGINAFDRCRAVSCSNDDGGGSGGGGGGAQGGAQGQIEFGAGTSNEWFGYGGSVGQNSTAGRAGLVSSYQYVASNGTSGSITISYDTGTPSAPSSLRGLGGISSVDLEWNAPAAAGGAAISDYAVQYSTDGGTTWSSSTLVGSARTSLTVTGLTNGTPYVFRVAAVSAEGTGDFSPLSAPITPYAAPSAPTLTELEAQDGALRAAFTAPADGAPVTGYEYRIDGGPWLPASGTSSPIAIPGLVNGTTYDVQLRATSSVGAGAASNTLSATPIAVPGAPTIVSATAAPGSVSLEVSPGFDGGTPITHYEYRIDGGGWVSSGSTDSPIVISGLDDGTAYALAVRAVNSSGAGAASDEVTVRTPGTPAAPTGITVTPGDETLTVAYSLGDSNGSPIERVEYRLGSGAWTEVPTPGTFVLSGLDNGTSYGVQLRAVNGLGTGAASPVVSGTPRGLASAPVITAVTATDPVTLSVDFTAPVSDGGSAIIGYEYSTDGGATWRARDEGDTGSPLTLTTLSVDGTTPLDSGETYPIELRAVTAVGPGAASAVMDGVPVDVPEAPQITAVTPRSGALAVAFAPGANGGRAITEYQYSVDGGSWTSTGSLATSFVIGGLTDGQPVTVRVRAVSSVGAGAASAPETATPASAPERATVTSVVRSDRTLTAAITPGADGGATVTAWQYSTDGGATWATAAGTSLPLAITSPSADTATRLVNGQGYSLLVRAVNSAGTGPASNIVTVAPASAPPRPTVTATPGDGTASVAFALAGDGGSPVSRIEYSFDGDTWTDTASLASPFVLTGLTNGTALQVQVRATNAIGVGAASTPVSVTPRTVPGAPTAVQASANTSALDVSWTAPASDGGSAVSSYTARVYGTATGTTVIGSCTTSSTSCTVGSLTNGTEYYVAVTATNAAGDGPASAPRATGTPLARPSAPTITSVTAGDQRLTVAFSAGAAGDRAIQRYQYTTNGGTTWTDLSGLSSPLVISDLTNGTTYSVQLRAVSAAGAGAASNTGSGKPVGYPGVPGDITATGANTSIVVSWSPADANGGVIASYTATAFSAAEAGSTIRTCTTSTTSCTLTGLTNNTTYYVSVQTLTTGGLYSERSNPRIAATPGTVPGAPTAVAAVAGNGTASVSWTAPAAVGTSAVSGYQVYCSADGGDYVLCATVASASTSASVSGLTNGTEYRFRVTARNATGYGAASSPSAQVVPLAPGVAPTFGTPTRTADGFTVAVSNVDPDATYAVSTPAGGEARIEDGVVTVTGLEPGASASVTVTVTRSDRMPAAAAVSGTALAAGVAPEFGTVVRTVDGFTVELENLDGSATYEVDTTAGTAALEDGVITVTGLEAGAPAIVTVRVSKSGSTDAEADVTGTALVAGVAPTFTDPVRTSDGFTVGIVDLDDDATYSVATSAGTVTLDGDVITVTGLSAGGSAEVTVTVVKSGSTDASGRVSAAALDDGTAPALGAVARTEDGFTVAVTDWDPDADYAVSTAAGAATIVDGVVTVTGLEPGQSTWVTVTVTRAGQVPVSSAAMGWALEAGVAPVLGVPTRTVDGFTAVIANLDPSAVYAASSTAGEVEVIDGVITVTGLAAGERATVMVTVAKTGAAVASSTVTGEALEAGVVIEFGRVTRTADGFTVPLLSMDPDAAYTVAVSSGVAAPSAVGPIARITAPTPSAAIRLTGSLITVTGLAPGQPAVVTVTATKPLAAVAVAATVGAALDAGVAPQLGKPASGDGWMSVLISDYDPDAQYEVTTTAGTVTRIGAYLIVTGLRPGESAVLSVFVYRDGAVEAESTVTVTAPAAGTSDGEGDGSGNGGSGDGGSGNGGDGSGSGGDVTGDPAAVDDELAGTGGDPWGLTLWALIAALGIGAGTAVVGFSRRRRAEES